MHQAQHELANSAAACLDPSDLTQAVGQDTSSHIRHILGGGLEADPDLPNRQETN